MTCRACKFFRQCFDEARALHQRFDPEFDGEHKCVTKQFVLANNAERIRAMTDEELAAHNVYESFEESVDYNCEDEPYINYTMVYKTSDDSVFYDEQHAIDYELAWLQRLVGEAE